MRICCLLPFFLFPSALFAQGTQADFDRAAGLGKRFAVKVPRGKVEPTWYDNDTKFWYANELATGKKEIVVVDVAKGTREIVKEPPKASGEKPEGEVPRTEVNDFFLHPDSSPQTLDPISLQRPTRASGTSPDGKWRAVIEDSNVVLWNVKADTVAALTTDGKVGDAYNRVSWSPDSTKFIAMKTKSGGDRKVTLVESSPKAELQPKTSTYAYLKPGDPIPWTKPHLFDVATKKEIPVSDELFPNPWDLGREHWSPDSKRFYFLYNQRGHTVMRVNAIDAATGKVAAVVDEECKTFFDYANKTYLQHLDATDELLWMSERHGWNHLYLVNRVTGKATAITEGDWAVRRIDGVDVEKREIRFQSVGFHAGQDPYHVHCHRIRFDGTGLVNLSDGDGTHTPPQYSPDKKHYLIGHSRVDLPPVTELRRTSDGEKILELEKADIGELTKAGWKPPERFAAKGRDGRTDICGLIHRPTNFDPKKKYPVIEYIYAGPHDHHVPKRFNPGPGSSARMAELGFIVVQIDGMGTNWRSKAFHDVCWKNLGDSGFPDRIPWIKAAAAKYPEMDLTKGVGIFGGSAGGQSSTRALLAFGDFYTTAVSDCGCHDNRMDKIWWNELWMSWPIGKHYEEQSNVTQAKNLKGKLMLVVGELDRNVDPSSTLQVTNALIRANKDFDFLLVPGGGHGACETPYGQRRRADFFIRHLWGTEPRAK